MATVVKAAFGTTILSEYTQPELEHTGQDMEDADETDCTATKIILNTLVSKSLESDCKKRRRKECLRKVEELYRIWAEEAMKLPAGSCHIFVFGSVRLNLELEDGDIDLLCSAPMSEVGRDIFFSSFPAIIEEHMRPEQIHTVTEAIVPVIKMSWRGIQVDLAFAPLDLPNPTLIENEELMMVYDDRTRHSSAGVRNGETVAKSIPNMTVFWGVARAVKWWATRRNIYGNMYGYLGGGTTAIMVANECQKAPLRGVSKIIQNFFDFYSKHLRDLHTNSTAARQIISVQPDAAKHFTPGKQESLLIVNPASPYTNNARNVQGPTLRHLAEEFERAKKILSENDITEPKTWEMLVTPIDFFKEHSSFLEVTIIADTNTKFGYWNGYCNSRIRMLAQILEDDLKNKLTVTLNPTEYSPTQDWIDQHRLVSEVCQTSFGTGGEEVINLDTSESDEEEEEEESNGGTENGANDTVKITTPQPKSKKDVIRQQLEPTVPEKPTAGVHYIGLNWVSDIRTNISLDSAVARFRSILKASKSGMYGPIVRVVDAANIPSWVYNEPPSFEEADLSTPLIRNGAVSPEPSKPGSPLPPAAVSMRRGATPVTPPPAVAMRRPGAGGPAPPAAAPMKRPSPPPENESIKRTKEGD